MLIIKILKYLFLKKLTNLCCAIINFTNIATQTNKNL